MRLYNKINNWLDFANSYTLRKAAGILQSEFNIAAKHNDINYAHYVIDTAEKIASDYNAFWIGQDTQYNNFFQDWQAWGKRLQQLIQDMHDALSNGKLQEFGHDF